MTHAIAVLENSLSAVENNELINRREGKIDQADVELVTAKEIREALEALREMRLPSQFQPGSAVSVFGQLGTVIRVTFATGKVTYDVSLYVGGEDLRNVDSTHVSAGIAQPPISNDYVAAGCEQFAS